MNVSPIRRAPASLGFLLLVSGVLAGPLAPRLSAQVSPAAANNPDARVARIEVTPDTATVVVGERAPLVFTAVDATGRPVPEAYVAVYVDGAEVGYDQQAGEVVGLAPGRTSIMVRVRVPNDRPIGYADVIGTAIVRVLPPPIDRLQLTDARVRYYAGVESRLAVRALAGGEPREVPELSWTSSDPNVARVWDGLLEPRRPGTARITVSTPDGVTATHDLTVVASPVTDLVLAESGAAPRVGDVTRLRARPVDDAGGTVDDADVSWIVDPLEGQPYDAMWMEREGADVAAFVPNEPGRYRITARVGAVVEHAEITAAARPPRRTVELVAHGVAPLGQSTTDLWAFEGLDGRDYVYTGTYSGNNMYAWDVSDPARPTIVDSVSFDGRRVNDVKINEDRTIAIVTSEHAANRQNGLTVVDIAEPAHPRKLAHYAEGLTGGVHNTWIRGDLVYAVHYGTRALHIIDISDPTRPHEVGRWQLPNEDRFLHDVMIEDGLAYLSYWNDGLVILDVGNGIAGGTPTEPAFVSQYAYRYRLGSEAYGNTHHAIRYGNYVFTGDEIFGCAECVNGPRGYIHVIDVTDIAHPREVAYYRVPEAGAHNIWAEDDKLFIGYYQAGLRIVDVSGELRGDLYRQGREIGWFMTEDGTGSYPNATDTWGAQPFKGVIYASDGASGLWVTRLEGASLVP
ncbi:MAG: hypothetical protein PVF05_00740 [Gemmatimonadales bacterium]|jgi:hypothetical protein